MPSVPHWDTAAEAWDQVTIGDAVVPGMALVTGPGVARKIDVKSSPGKDGARVRDRGYDPARFTIECIVWTEDQFNDLLPILDAIQPKRRGGERQPVDVSHPALSILGIRSMYVERVSLPQVKAGKLHVQIHAIEWVTQPRTSKAADMVATLVQVQTQVVVDSTSPGTTAFERYENARQRPGTGP